MVPPDEPLATDEVPVGYSWRRLGILAVGVVGFGLLLLVAGDELRRNLGAVEAALVALGPWAMVAYLVFAVVGASLLVPESAIGVLAGALFGPLHGLAAASTAFLLASLLQYVLGRRLLRAPVQRMLQTRPTLAAIQRVALEDQRSFQVLLRLSPLNPALVSYAMGAAEVRLVPFLIGCAAYLPHLVLEVYLGTTGRAVVASAGTGSHPGWPAMAGVGLGLVALGLVSHRAYRTVLRALEEEA